MLDSNYIHSMQADLSTIYERKLQVQLVITLGYYLANRFEVSQALICLCFVVLKSNFELQAKPIAIRLLYKMLCCL